MPQNEWCGMCEHCTEINEVLGHATEALEAERERYERDREVLALAVVELTRLTQSMQSTLQRAGTRLAGITPFGKEPT